MNRYFSSFVISLFVYVSLFAGAVVFFNKNDTFSDKEIKKPNVVTVCMVAPQPKLIKEPIKKKIVKKKKVVKKKKPIKKKIIKKELPKPSQSLKKEEIIKEKIVKEEVVKEQVAMEQPEIKKTQQVVAKEKPYINPDEIKAKQNLFFTELRNKINKNKSYPRRARRRGIEGNVEVKFFLQSDGSVKSIEFVSGKNIFKKSVIEAIENSFPVEVDKTLFSFPKEFKISIEYILS
ncbi:TonB family protein [Sulfurimonas lithotrophica]|uniref:TonB family protein n=1 Tax=Sulfurimonas lithotrophica TaxID=2590022 RepID=A0A5P8P1D1_9BACT|nr:energy transducer TonB [Sulfurimonas lithotrophica]QFR49465.1 TonB family protein [Sulfurimonas lithotrophica]